MRTEIKDVVSNQSASKPNPSLKGLEILVGEWDTEMSDMSFVPDPSARFRGHAYFQWLEGGAFLIMYMGGELGGAPSSAIEVIGRDESAYGYSVLYFDSRGISRIYQMSLGGSEWKLWRNSPEFSQRFTGTFSDDGNTIAARWEKSTDGVRWEHDFNLTYTKVK